MEKRYYFYSPTLSYGEIPLFLADKELPEEGFASLYSVSASDAEAITKAGTCAKYCGVVGTDTIWIDVDSEDAVQKVRGKLDELGVDYVWYSTGNRGSHFGVRINYIASHLLPARSKAWVGSTFEGLADLSIYTHLHLFRLPGTRHASTGRKKQLISSMINGRALELPNLARSDVRHYKAPAGNPGKDYSVFDCRRVMGNSVPMLNGERHASLVRLAYALRDEAGLEPSIAVWWMLEVNKMFEERKSEEEVENIIRKVYGGS